MAQLRADYRRQVLQCAIQDFLRPRPVWASLRELSGYAQAAIRRAFAVLDVPADCALFALGRLGTAEFDVLSDADLLFVRDDNVSGEQTAAAAASLLTLLSSYTSDGIVFTVDLRLRPHGSQGELATTPSQLARYFQNEGQPWEALSYTKLRHIAGSSRIAAQVFDAVRGSHARYAGDPSFRAHLREMRQRLENSVGRGNFKKGWGGYYDIDFIASTLAIEHGLRVPPCDIVARLAELARANLLSADDFAALSRQAEFLRALEHAMRLVHGGARNRLPSSHSELGAITAVMRASLGGNFFRGRALPELVEELLAAVRDLYTRIFGM
jgi:glutamate-ammonia-ligase adenylyltransferase